MIRRAFDGTGPWSGLAILCWLVGVVMLGTILMSPSGWQWWLDVHSVRGHELDGLVYYSVDGTKYTLDDPSSFAGSRPGERTVYFLTSDPGDGTLHNSANEALDWGLTVGPGAIGLGLVVTGFVVRRLRRRGDGAIDSPDGFGQGLPSATIEAIRARNTAGGPGRGQASRT